MDQTLNDFVLNLLADPDSMAAFELDPQQVLDSAGLGELTPADVQEVVPLVMDSVGAAGYLNGALDGGSGGLTVDTPFGPVSADAGAALDPNDPVLLGSLDSPLGGGMLGVSKHGASFSGDLDLTAVTDPGDALDTDLPGAGQQQDLADGLTGGANTAADLMTGGAAITAGLVNTGADLAAGALTDPTGAADALLSSVPVGGLDTLPVDVPALPVELNQTSTSLPAGTPAAQTPELPVEVPDLPVGGPGVPVAVPELPVDLPVVDDVLGGDLLGGDLPVVNDVLGSGLLGGDLPVVNDVLGGTQASGLNLDGTLDTVDGVHADAVQTVNETPVADLVNQTGVNDVVNGSPLGDVVGLAEPGATTDLVRDTLDLDLGL